MVAKKILTGLLALSIPFASCAPTGISHCNGVTIKITNNVENGSAIIDCQNNGHINVINGGNGKTIKDESRNSGSSPAKIPRGEEKKLAPKYKPVPMPTRAPQPKPSSPSEVPGNHIVNIEIKHDFKTGETKVDSQNNGHINVVNGGSNNKVEDSSTNSMPASAPDSASNPDSSDTKVSTTITRSLSTTRDNTPLTAPTTPSYTSQLFATFKSSLSSLLKRASGGGPIDITLNTGLHSGSNSTNSMNDNQIEVWLDGRPEGINITVSLTGEGNSTFVNSGNGNKVKIFVGPIPGGAVLGNQLPALEG